MMKEGEKIPLSISRSGAAARILTSFLVLANLLGSTVSFSSQHGVLTSTRSSSLFMKGEADFLSKLNPFGREDSADDRADVFSSSTPRDSEAFVVAGEALIAKAKAVIVSDFAIQDPSLLDESFIWIGPFLERPLGKSDYLASGRFFSLRTAFPGLDYRPHDFRLDVNDPLTVRCTVRPQGLMTGPLRLRAELVQPNGKRLVGPPEAVSLTFDPNTGKVVKMCSEFAMDRFVGNTFGLCGVMAAAAIAGVPPSDWEIYPIPTVVSRFFGRPADPVEEVSTSLSPFPETVMIQLVKGILATNLAADDPSLLAKDFSFITPSVGPIGKAVFLESYASQEFGGFEPEFSNFRVDPFDPRRVWVDVKLVGPGLNGPPEAFSFTINDDGFCTRMTAGAVMDPSIGNTGGLTGEAGIKYALGRGDLDFTVRPLPLALGRLKKTILSPFTKISADNYVLEGFVSSKVDEGTPESTEDLAAAKMQGEGEAETEVRIQVEQDAEQKNIQEEGNDEIRKVEPKIDEDLMQQNTPVKALPEFKLPSPPKIPPSPPKIPPSPPKIPPSPLKALPSPPKLKLSSPSKITPPSFFADAFKPFASFAKEMEQIDSERSKQAASVEVSKKLQLEKVEQQRAATEENRKLEEEQKKRAQERKKAEEDRKAELDRKKADAAAAEALAKENAQAKVVMEKRRQEADAKRIQAEKAELARKKAAEALAKENGQAKVAMEKRRQEADAKRIQAEKAELARKKAAEALARENAQAKAAMEKRKQEEEANRLRVEKAELARKKVAAAEALAKENAAAKAATEKRRQEAEASRLESERKRKQAQSTPKPPRPSFQIPKIEDLKPAPRASPASGRPSFQIPTFGTSGNAAAKPPVTSKPSPPKPRPSFQIPQLGTSPNPKPKAETKPTTPPMPRPTFQLPKFGSDKPGPSDVTKPRPSITIPRASVQIPKATKAPNGVPTIVSWQKRPNNVLSGQIFGSPNFKDGERIETSQIAAGDFENGSVVTTVSGSKYFLSGQTPRELLAASKPTVVAATSPKVPARSTSPIPKQQVPKASASNSAKSPPKTSLKAPPATVKRPTFSLSALFGGDSESQPTPRPSGKVSIPKASPKPSTKEPPSQRSAPVPTKKTAPKGTPTISRWKQNRDKSITGFINGSPAFEEGERITTSPIVGGTAKAGEVVVTGSGSRYFLS